jgi:hypothetical protein
MLFHYKSVPCLIRLSGPLSFRVQLYSVCAQLFTVNPCRVSADTVLLEATIRPCAFLRVMGRTLCTRVVTNGQYTCAGSGRG